MPDTKAKKTSAGWIDLDTPGKVFPTRNAVRLHRRDNKNTKKIDSANLVSYGPTTKPATDVTMIAVKNSDYFTDLQRKLYHRLTSKQGVEFDNALVVLKDYGYNKAASYGHMRKAGATHFEAKIVVELDNPQISVTYGRLRSAGKDHTSALAEALK